MIVNFDTNKKVIWYNPILSESEAQKYLNTSTVWTEFDVPQNAPIQEGFLPVLYFDEKTGFWYELEEIPTEEEDARIEELELDISELLRGFE